MMRQLMKEVTSVLVKKRRERVIHVHQHKGYEEMPLPAVGKLERHEVVEYIVLPEFLIRFIMEKRCTTYVEASQYIYGSHPITVYHVSNYMEREVCMKTY